MAVGRVVEDEYFGFHSGLPGYARLTGSGREPAFGYRRLRIVLIGADGQNVDGIARRINSAAGKIAYPRCKESRSNGFARRVRRGDRPPDIVDCTDPCGPGSLRVPGEIELPGSTSDAYQVNFGSNSPRFAWKNSECVFYRESRAGDNGERRAVLVVRPATDFATERLAERFAHEYALKDVLDPIAAARPLLLTCERRTPCLVLEDCGNEPLELIPAPLSLLRFLRLAHGIAGALGRLHARGLIHRDIKPAHILVDRHVGEAKFTGFGIATQGPRQRQSLEPPEFIAGTPAYMAPEQTGRMNRSIDSRCDLYALGVTFYLLVTGMLPFAATDPIEWLHCHIARQPLAPSERAPHIPEAVSRIIMKLLAKMPEDRYQTAAGVEHDLCRCLDQWDTQGRIDDFLPGAGDVPDHLLIPEKLYGRSREITRLVGTFNHVIRNGSPALILVTGYSGIGKSSIVNELHKARVPPRGLFAAGKFERGKSDIPYSTLVQAFQSLVRPLLGKHEAELSAWRDALLKALGPNTQLMVELVPELEFIVGAQPPAPELPLEEARSRLHLVFQRFIGVFARPEHPLALFLDDLQWLDAATLDVLEYLLVSSDLRHLLLVGAYRDNEVDADHPLALKLAMIRKTGTRVDEIALAPLTCEHVTQLVADTIRRDPESAAPLAQLVHAKTGGNPFFVNQFLHALAEENLLTFDHRAACWSWDIGQIHATGYTDNVADLMAGKLARLPAPAQHALQQLAGLGGDCTIAMLSAVLDATECEVHDLLWPALRNELVELGGGVYRFTHDRVQEAAYALIATPSIAHTHLRIGRCLLAHTPPAQLEENIFDIVGQLNRGAGLIDSRDEREQLAELNLLAGRRARASAAYAAARAYTGAGAALLTGDSWARRHALCFSLDSLRAECDFLTGATADARMRLDELAGHALTHVERAAVASLGIDLYFSLGDRNDRAIAIGLDYLRGAGIGVSPHPTDDEAQEEYERIVSRLRERSDEDLFALPLMTDPDSLATLHVLIKLGPPIFQTGQRINLFVLLFCRAIALSLEYGHADASCPAYTQLGVAAGARFNDYRTAFRLGRLACGLVDRRALTRFEARTHTTFAAGLAHWAQHVRAGRDPLRRAAQVAERHGNLLYGAYSRVQMTTNLLAAGDALPEVLREAEHSLVFARKTQYGGLVDIIEAQRQLVRTLCGLTPGFGTFDDSQFDERGIEQRFATHPGWPSPRCFYWVRKMQARFFAGDHEAAVEAAAQAQRFLWGVPLSFELAEYYFYAALSHALAFDFAPLGERQRHRATLAGHQRQLEAWSADCPENFACRSALAGAELARIDGDEPGARQRFERAIRSARENGFIHIEALACELAARFHATRGLETFAQMLRRSARDAYLNWGADGKVRQLEETYPHLRTREPVLAATRAIETSVERLDLSIVTGISQAMSGEFELAQLLDKLLRIALGHAGAQRCVLTLARGDEQRIAAHASVAGDAVVVTLCDEPATTARLPESVLQYVVRTRESILLDDACTGAAPFAADAYIGAHRVRSVLCLPLVNQTKLVGTLYLENNLAARVFVPGRIAVLKLLASQAATTLENARLYQELAEREAHIRRLIDANIVGIAIWHTAGRIFEANDAFLRIIGYCRDDLVAGRIRWTELTPPEWHEIDRQKIQTLMTAGKLAPFEKEYFRKDGSRVSVLIGMALLEAGGDESIGFVLDLTERKRAEAEASENERRYLEAQMELAHANRVATMGQLTASIAHEVQQPITAAVTHAAAALHWLKATPPDLGEIRESLDDIVSAGRRAGGIIEGIRELVKKAPLRQEQVDINEAVRAVIDLVQGEASKNGVSVTTSLDADLPFMLGDRVQLQQLMLNLIMNAIEAMCTTSGKPRELQISTTGHAPNCVSVVVRDTGPGLPTKETERVFDAFYTTKTRGLGMGLSICRSIVEAHRGKLHASANVPHGAVFEFVLPGSNKAS
ncbi:AAA family ATPase [Paraburkholderia sp. Ac-20342]|nr:ATP-binding sensor histidine kinase [Paraburkholderia sp. Ac-20342]MBN3846821.1 AAA family ATPase [Paraburkholderia sp. Ac-20342]